MFKAAPRSLLSSLALGIPVIACFEFPFSGLNNTQTPMRIPKSRSNKGVPIKYPLATWGSKLGDLLCGSFQKSGPGKQTPIMKRISKGLRMQDVFEGIPGSPR